ncbi:MAG: hypothetical protein PHV37_00785 [Candidatus Gastranaerophilales bacterium]|nr:hypothetical protein [Candidatus Gastranaerophilales bacterium]
MRFFIIILTFLTFGFSAVAFAESNQPIVPQLQMGKKPYQLHTFKNTDKISVMKAMIDILQSDGYMINTANPQLGFIAGALDFDSEDTTVDIAEEFGASKAGLFWKGIRTASIEISANITDFGPDTKVRMIYKRKLLNTYGNPQYINEVTIQRRYEYFYDRVEQEIKTQKNTQKTIIEAQKKAKELALQEEAKKQSMEKEAQAQAQTQITNEKKEENVNEKNKKSETK